jgi:hypothetical protein
MTQKTVQPMYIMEVKDKKDWKEPKHSMKTPTPMVLTIAATVPAVFDMPATTPQIPSSFTHTAQKMYISYSNLKYQQSVHNCISSMNRMKLSHFFGSQTVSTIHLLFKESRWVGFARNNQEICGLTHLLHGWTSVRTQPILLSSLYFLLLLITIVLRTGDWSTWLAKPN